MVLEGVRWSQIGQDGLKWSEAIEDGEQIHSLRWSQMIANGDDPMLAEMANGIKMLLA